MAGFYDSSIAQQVEFHTALAGAGFTESDVSRVIQDPSLAARMYREIAGGTTAAPIPAVAKMEHWSESVARQIERAEQLWPTIVLPEPPADFAPRTESEVPLLHVPDTIDRLWARVSAPGGYTKLRPVEMNTDMRHLRLAPNAVAHRAPVWVAFDPEHGRGLTPASLWGAGAPVRDGIAPAAGEVLSALIQFPNWCRAWFGGTVINMAGYQLKRDGRWASLPRVSRWDDGSSLTLSPGPADRGSAHDVSPSIRVY